MSPPALQGILRSGCSDVAMHQKWTGDPDIPVPWRAVDDKSPSHARKNRVAELRQVRPQVDGNGNRSWTSPEFLDRFRHGYFVSVMVTLMAAGVGRASFQSGRDSVTWTSPTLASL